MAAIYRDLVVDQERNIQVVSDVADALGRGRNCLVLTQWTKHVDLMADQLTQAGFSPIVLKGGMGVKARNRALAQLADSTSDERLLVVATGPCVNLGFPDPRRGL